MRNVLALALVLMSAAAAEAAPCPVTIVRAPDDVREVVEQAVRAEPACTTALELRVVPTDGGLYVLARDEHGRVRERVVPHAQAAGVLVASWVADDAAATPPAPGPLAAPVIAGQAVAPVAPVVANARGAAPAASAAPGAPASDAALPAIGGGVAVAADSARGTPRWLAFGGMFAMSGSGGGGIRGELDLRTRGSWALGLAASASNWGMMLGREGLPYEATPTSLDTFDAKAVGYAALHSSWGKWRLRTAIGLGLVYTRATLKNAFMGTEREARGLFPAGEATLSFGRDLGASWALHAGPIVSVYMQEYQYDYSGPGYYGTETEGRELELMMFIAARHRL